MNPFANAARFEQFRHAAMQGDAELQRAQRFMMRAGATPAEVRISERAMRTLLLAVASSPAVLLVGPPGTGKTELMYAVVEMLNKDGDRFGFTSQGIEAEVVTPEEDWGYSDLVLGQTIVEGEVVSLEGALLRALADNSWLMLDEINRADMDRIFGGILTWLSRKRVKVGSWSTAGNSASPYPTYLSWSSDQADSHVNDEPGICREYVAGRDWRLMGTYNAVDAQRVFRMGRALSRRFKHVPVPPASATDFQEIIQAHVSREDLKEELKLRIGRLYRAHLDTDGAVLGPGMFVDMPAFIEIGISAYNPEGEPPTQSLMDSLTAEAYLSSIGSSLARFEPDVLLALEERVVESEALTKDDWFWIMSSLPTLQH